MEKISNDLKVVKLDQQNPEVGDKEYFKAKQEEAKQNLDNFQRDFEEKIVNFSNVLFELPGGKKTAQYLIDFLALNSKWTYTEAKFAVKVHEHLLDQYSEIVKKNQENVRLCSMDLEAINYFFMKHEGKGIEEATIFYEYVDMIIEILKPTELFKKELERDKQKRDTLQFIYTNYMENIEPASEIFNNQNINQNNGF